MDYRRQNLISILTIRVLGTNDAARPSDNPTFLDLRSRRSTNGINLEPPTVSTEGYIDRQLEGYVDCPICNVHEDSDVFAQLDPVEGQEREEALLVLTLPESRL
ncbi:hypothetical protein CDL15_Pgr008373 [Punica granatum]|uniref:Uncharacterized protein n=1 Tax=Punica granatum TaxID=22663 RepID=A0A218WPY7_PUNGR|nr:hypothetical protein CDL15_Pgr008373 [Punica granatum]